MPTLFYVNSTLFCTSVQDVGADDRHRESRPPGHLGRMGGQDQRELAQVRPGLVDVGPSGVFTSISIYSLAHLRTSA